jgi:hypothetical protein
MSKQTEKNHRNLQQDCMTLGQDLNLGRPGYEVGVLTLANNTGTFMDERLIYKYHA